MGKKIKVIVECGKDLFACYSVTPIGDVTMLSGDGDSVEAAKKDFMLCVEECRNAYPGDKRFDNLEFTFHYDIRSFFEYFSFLNASEVARRAGISSESMRQYTGGFRNATENTYEKLSAAIKEIKKEFTVSSF